MIIGIPKEIMDNENRVGIVPVGVETLSQGGHQVIIEGGAGIGSGTATIISLVINISITGIIFINAAYISEKLGSGGTKAVSKITAILLAAIAVMMIRIRILEVIKSSL